jgi:hypothetical protein
MVKIKNKVTEKEAMQFLPLADTGEQTGESPPWFHKAVMADVIEPSTTRAGEHILTIHDKIKNHGDLIVRDTDWIIRGLDGELYPCTNEVFERSYEVVDANAA